MEVSGANWILHLLLAGVRSWLGQRGQLEDMPASDARRSSCGQTCDAPWRKRQGQLRLELQGKVTIVSSLSVAVSVLGLQVGGCWARTYPGGRYRKGMAL